MTRLKYISPCIFFAYTSIEEIFSSPWISIDLEKIHCALSSFFFFFLNFFRYYIDQCSQGCCFAKKRQASHRLSRQINGIGQFGELFRSMGVRSWRKLWKTEVKLPPEGISMVVPKERLQIVVNSCPRFFLFVFFRIVSIERNDFPFSYSRRSSLVPFDSRGKDKKKIFLNNKINFPLHHSSNYPSKFRSKKRSATTSGINIFHT